MKKKYIVGVVVIVGILLGLFIFSKLSESSIEAFAVCLSENDVTMYGSPRCPHCNNQKAMFGESFMYITYIDCDLSDECITRGVTLLPTWEIEGELYTGENTGEKLLSALSALTGCTI